MKPLLISLTIGVLFVAGAAGTYFLMPVIAPERVAQARYYLDSLDAVAAGDTTFLAAADSAFGAPSDSLAVPSVDSTESGVADTVATTTTAAEGENEASEPSEPPSPSPAELAKQAQAEQARELSNVLSKLEDPELRALVSNLDPDVLTILYRESSARNKTRLLQAIPPERAAQFVRGLIVPVSGQ